MKATSSISSASRYGMLARECISHIPLVQMYTYGRREKVTSAYKGWHERNK